MCEKPGNPGIYIVLPVHDRKRITLDFIRCLQEQTFQDYILLLVDDGSNDGTASAVKEQMQDSIIIQGNGNLWWAGSINAAYEWLVENAIDDTRLVLLINDDVLFEPDFLQNAITLMHGKEKTLLLAREKLYGSHEILETGVHADFSVLSFITAEKPSDINCLATRGLFLKWSDFMKIGPFKARTLKHYCSDYEFTMRAHRQGYHLMTSERLVLTHVMEQNKSIEEGENTTTRKNIMSIRHNMNPLTWTAFVLIVSPRRWLLPNLFRVWYRAIFKYSLKS